MSLRNLDREMGTHDKAFEGGPSNMAGPRLLHNVEVVGGGVLGCAPAGILIAADAVLGLDLANPVVILVTLLVGAACALLAVETLVPLIQRVLVRFGLARLPVCRCGMTGLSVQRTSTTAPSAGGSQQPHIATRSPNTRRRGSGAMRGNSGGNAFPITLRGSPSTRCL